MPIDQRPLDDKRSLTLGILFAHIYIGKYGKISRGPGHLLNVTFKLLTKVR